MVSFALFGAVHAQKTPNNSGSPSPSGISVLRDTRIGVYSNAAANVQTEGSHMGVGGGSLYSHDQDARILANSVEALQNALIAQSAVTVATNRAQNLTAKGGDIEANGVVVENQSRLEATIDLRDNKARDVATAATSTRALFGLAKAGAGAQAVINSVAVTDQAEFKAKAALTGNTTAGVNVAGGMALANALMTTHRAVVSGSSVAIAGNRANAIRADGGTANVNALHVLGKLHDSTVQLLGNRATSVTSSNQSEVVANGTRIATDGEVTQSRVSIARNTAEQALGDEGRPALVNSLDNSGKLVGSAVDIEGNSGKVLHGGIVNSLSNAGKIQNSGIRISSNQGLATRGTASSVVNKGSIASSNIVVLNNAGIALNGGTVNSVVNGSNGHIKNAQILIARNTGAAIGGGKAATANSVVNNGQLSGQILISDNQGTAQGNGIVNSLINQGTLTGKVRISGNRAQAGSGAIANSVINQGAVSGSINVIGGNASGPTGSVVVSGAGLTGKGNPRTQSSAGVISNSVTVLPGG